MRAIVPAPFRARLERAQRGYWEGLERAGVSEVTFLLPDSDPGRADFTADEPFLMLWGEAEPAQLYAAARLHVRHRGAATLLLAPRGGEEGWAAAPDRQGRICYLEERPPLERCEGVFSSPGALCEPMPGLPLPEREEELLGLLRFWMDRGELWGARSEGEVGSRPAFGEEVTENPLYFL